MENPRPLEQVRERQPEQGRWTRETELGDGARSMRCFSERFAKSVLIPVASDRQADRILSEYRHS